ncbi:MAG: Kelch repeat-containing protein [Anaerolineae bacterium]
MRSLLSLHRPATLAAVALLLLLIILLTGPVPVAAQAPPAVLETVLYAEADATVDSVTPSTNYGSATTLIVSFDSPATRCVLLRFDLGAIPAGATIVQATLTLRAVSSSGASPVTVGLYDISTPWTESTVTWSAPWVLDRPDITGYIAETDVGASGTYAWEGLESAVQYWLAGPNYGAGLCGSSATGTLAYSRTFDSDESTGTRPALYVTYLDPGTPTVAAGPGLANPSWETVAPLPGSLLGASGAWAANRFFVIGGDIASGATSVVRIYNPATGVWTTGPNRKPTAVQDACAVTIDSRIFVVGGYRGEGTGTGVVEVLDTDTLTWTTDDPLPEARWGHACGAIGNTLILAGGTSDGTAALSTAMIFSAWASPGSRWQILPAMSTARNYAAGAMVGGRLYVAGGVPSGSNTDLATVEVYDPHINSWATLPSLTFPRGAPGAYGYGSRLIVCGGGWTSYRDTCEAYDTRKGTAGAWTAYPGLVTGRRQFAYASSGDAIYLAGGWRGGVLATAEAAFGARWRPLPPLPEGAIAATAVYAGGRLIVIDDAQAPDGTVLIYEPATGTWTHGPDKPTAVVRTCAGLIGGKISVPGGSHDNVPSAVLEVLDTATWSWSAVTTDPVPVAIQSHACGVIDGRLYLAGGVTDVPGQFATSFAFDPAWPEGDRWYSIASPDTARHSLGGAVVNGRLYVAGGVAPGGALLGSAEVYETSSDTWTTLERRMSISRYAPGAMEAGTRLIVCGGDVGPLDETCEAYDTGTGTSGSWVTFAGPTRAAASPAYASDGHRLYAAGGYNGAALRLLQTIDAGFFETLANVMLPLVVR